MNLGRYFMGNIWNAVTGTFNGIIHTLSQGGFPGMAWLNFEQGVKEYLGWANLTAASKIRYRVTHKVTALPEAKPLEAKVILPNEDVAPALEIVAQNNPWFAEHKHVTDPLVAQRAEWVRATEERYWNARREQLAAYFRKDKKVKIEPLERLDMRRRTAHGEIANVSEQVQMAVPEISDAFPFAEYFTRDDKRVRPTHVPMIHFVATRSWHGWPRIVPLDGFSCRCFLRYATRKEAIGRGWMNKDGLAKFEAKWPNSLSRHNYEKGLFPDKGWAGPKFWTFPSPPIRVQGNN